MLASVLLQVQMARLLLEYGAKVNLHDERRQTALHYAVLQKDEVRGSGSGVVELIEKQMYAITPCLHIGSFGEEDMTRPSTTPCSRETR